MPKPATPSQVSYLRHLLKQVGGEEPDLAKITDAEASSLIDGLKAKRGKPVWYGNGQFSHWEKDASSSLEPPAKLPKYTPADSPKHSVIRTRSDGIEIVGPDWIPFGPHARPDLTFGARPGPKWEGEGYKGGGMGYIELTPDLKEPGTFWVAQVTVLPPWQRTGIATDLYREATRWLHARGGKLQSGWLTSEAAEKMWKKWREQGLAEGTSLKMDKWAMAARVAARFMIAKGYFEIGDIVLIGKYKNSHGKGMPPPDA